jgi:hypothetical protein
VLNTEYKGIVDMERLLILPLIGFFTLMSCGPCSLNNNAVAIRSLANKSISGKITSGTGLFASAVGKKFISNFDKNGHFKTATNKEQVTTQGTYSYERKSSEEGQIKLEAQSGENAGESVLITLTFTEKNEGVYKAHVTKGGWGEQTGTFSVKE